MLNLKTLYLSDKTIIVEDVDFLGIDWKKWSLKSSSSSLCAESFNILSEFHLDQLIEEPTHVAGNILDLIRTDSSY